MSLVQSPSPRTAQADEPVALAQLLPYLIAGVLFGAVLIKAEVISWYRIQEMFRFQSFHMYGILGSAFLTAFISLQLLKRMGLRTLGGEPITVAPKQLGKGYRYWVGGSLFGIGWAFAGVCPGPLFALIGSGSPVFVVPAVAALAGTWTYAQLRPHLPH